MLITAPVAAVYEPLWKGQIIGIDYDASIIAVEITELYTCEFIEQADPICGFETIDIQQISSEFPMPAVYDVVSVGDPVIGMSYGGLESTQWVTLAKITTKDTIYIEALFGDTGLLEIFPLARGYASIVVVPMGQISEFDDDADRFNIFKFSKECALCWVTIMGCGLDHMADCYAGNFEICHYCECGRCPCPSMLPPPAYKITQKC